MRTVNVRATASVANMVCGFDVLGMALEEPFDDMRLTLLDKREIIIHHTDGYGLPEEPDKNVAGAALLDMLQEYDREIGFELTVHKNIKPGSGLGSSAAGSAGVVVAANYLLDNYFSKN